MSDADASISGALVLVGTPIGNLGDLAPRAVEVLSAADWIAAEHPDHTRALLTNAGVRAGNRLRAVHQHNERDAATWIVDAIASGSTVAYASDAGMPGISDPGEALVHAVVEAGLPVEVVPGPSAFLTALVVSALPTDRFTFEGFLPRKGPERRARLAAVAASSCTVAIYESPHRVGDTLQDLAAACGDDRACAVVRELTKRFEEVVRGPLGTIAAAEPVGRGEYVIVIAGRDDVQVDADDATVRDALRREITDGATARDAAATEAAELGVPKRRAYELAIRIDT